MRNQWRQQQLLLLLHRSYRSSVQASTCHLCCRSQVPSFSNSFHRSIRFSDTPFHGSQFLRFFSSGFDAKPSKDSMFDIRAWRASVEKEAALFEKRVALLVDVFSKSELENEKIKLVLEENSVVFSDRLVFKALEQLISAPDAALRLFNWVFESDNEGISNLEVSFRLMVDILVDNCLLKELLDLGKKAPNLLDQKSKIKICALVCMVIEGEPWSVKLEKLLCRGEYSSGMVSRIVETLGVEDDKGLMFFKWIEDSGLFKHDENSCNAMLKVLAKEDSNERFWKMVEEMKKKSLGEGMRYVANEVFYDRVCGFIGRESWSDDVEKQLRKIDVEYSSDMVSRIVKDLGLKDDKGLTFFKWIEESGLFRHDQHTFNVMLKVLAKEDSSERFWKMSEEMKKSGFEMEQGTRYIAKELFFNKKTMYDGVNYLEFALGGVSKVSVKDCSSLLMSVLKRFWKLDTELFSLVLRIFKEHGIEITDSMFEGIWSLKNHYRPSDMREVMKALGVDSGFGSRVVIRLTGREEKSDEIMDNMEAPDLPQDYEIWLDLIRGFCWSKQLENASGTLQEMVKYVRTPLTKTDDGSCLCPINLVVTAYCNNNRALDARNLVSKLMEKNNVRPYNRTFNTLIHRFLAKGQFREALNVLILMKQAHKGYHPPEWVVFIDDYLWSAESSDDDAMAFLDTILALYKCRSTHIFRRLFSVYLWRGRKKFAQDLLSKCPKFVQKDAKVLEMFSPKIVVQSRLMGPPVKSSDPVLELPEMLESSFRMMMNNDDVNEGDDVDLDGH